jgi:hypothetical protein
MIISDESRDLLSSGILLRRIDMDINIRSRCRQLVSQGHIEENDFAFLFDIFSYCALLLKRSMIYSLAKFAKSIIKGKD